MSTPHGALYLQDAVRITVHGETPQLALSNAGVTRHRYHGARRLRQNVQHTVDFSQAISIGFSWLNGTGQAGLANGVWPAQELLVDGITEDTAEQMLRMSDRSDAQVVLTCDVHQHGRAMVRPDITVRVMSISMDAQWCVLTSRSGT